MRTTLFLLAVLLLAGCAAGPDYSRPDLEQPAAWRTVDSMTAAVPAVTYADTSWWRLFGDTVLVRLIDTALIQNNDVRIAAARVEQYMGLYGVTRSDLFPKFGGGAGAARGQFEATGDGSVTRPTNNSFHAEVFATWELDLWGKIRRATEAARADVLAAEENRRGVVVSVATLVAESYIDLLALDQKLLIARKTLASRERTLDLFAKRKAEGDISDLETSMIESEYWLARAAIPSFEAQIARRENAINFLLGRNPGPISRGGSIDDLAVPTPPAGLPSQLLEQRPDVRFAEEQLIAANALIGVAKAQYFPSISLTGLFGTASTDLSNLFKSTSLVWNVGGELLQPIFRWGEISGQVDAAVGAQKAALEAYVGSVRNAFRDAEDALVTRTKGSEQYEAERGRVNALGQYARLAGMRYDEGVTSYLEVLDAERSLFSASIDAVTTQAEVAKGAVGIYRAFGGGWVDWASMNAAMPADPVEPREP